MAVPSFVAGDWGTSHLRLFLCDRSGNVLDRIPGPGIAAMTSPFPAMFESLLSGWESRYGALPAVLCGMVGSNIGWAQTPYVECPARPEKIIDGCISLRAGRVHVMPGIRCENRFRTADFMRGEETQLLGALTLDPQLCKGRHLVCMPGTHTKWTLLEDGVIREFLSAPTGELFAALRAHSVLVREDLQHPHAPGNAAFQAGVACHADFPQAQLVHRLFECRGRVLSGDLHAQDAAAFLSGLLIASDVAGALELFGNDTEARTVYLIGASSLTQLYAGVLAGCAHETRQLDGEVAALAGLTQIHRRLTAQAAANV
jgi:2-dehydro-3-deoxygalactonokinase